MRIPRRGFLHLVAGAAALPVVSRMAHAQAYPTRPITSGARDRRVARPVGIRPERNRLPVAMIP
jgi:hypothetical protein